MRTMASTLGALPCLTACHHDGGHAGSEGDDHASHAEAPPSQEANHESHGSTAQLTLDDGRKWPVDEHTMGSAGRLAKLVSDAPAIESPDGAHALGEALDAELDVLVKGCKMTGPAHDQLHVFLMAFIPQVEELQTATDLGELQRAREEIGSLLAAYEEHFETDADAT